MQHENLNDLLAFLAGIAEGRLKRVLENWCPSLVYTFTIRADVSPVHVFLDHAQMYPKSMQIGFEWAGNFE